MSGLTGLPPYAVSDRTLTRQRRARAPPCEAEIFSRVLEEDLSQVPPEGEEDLNQDPQKA